MRKHGVRPQSMKSHHWIVGEKHLFCWILFVWPVNNHGIVLNLCFVLYSDGCRYDTTGNPEGQYEPGSQELVLLNKLGITDLQEIENIEFDYLIQF